jgi:hypothetical protein
MRTQDNDDVGSFAAMRRDLMKAMGDVQMKSIGTQGFQYRSTCNAIVTKK